jgi:hypothetical protein
MFVNYRCVSAMSRRASGGFLSPSSRTVLVFEYPESLFLVRAANPCQFPVFGVSVPIVQRVFLGAYVRAFPLDPVTTRPGYVRAPGARERAVRLQRHGERRGAILHRYQNLGCILWSGACLAEVATGSILALTRSERSAERLASKVESASRFFYGGLRASFEIP